MVRIFFRQILAEESEIEVAKKYFDVIESRMLAAAGDEILCRYSSIPYYNELERDINLIDAKLVNSYNQHLFIVDMENWYYYLEDYTPKTWFSLVDVLSDNYEGPYVLKGKTNSRKNLWRTHMFAKNKNELRNVYFRLQDDGFIGNQGIVIRQFEHFKKYGESISGAPITKEFRFFVYKKNIVAKGFYWSNHPEITEIHKPLVSEVSQSFVDEILYRVGDKCNFWVFDAAEREDGQWRIVELNLGDMSGLSCIDPNELYSNIKKVEKSLRG